MSRHMSCICNFVVGTPRAWAERAPLVLLFVAAVLAWRAPVASGEVIPGRRVGPSALSAEEIYILVNRESGKALSLAGGAGDGPPRFQVEKRDGSISQLWKLEPVAGNRVLICNVSGNSILLTEAGREDEDAEGAESAWILQPEGDGYFRFTHTRTGRALGANGAKLRHTRYRGRTAQQWALHPVRTVSEERHDFRMMGWAAVGGGTTGGSGGEVVTVSTPEEFVDHISRPEPLIVKVKGTIDFRETSLKSNDRYIVASNKSIIGLGADACIRGAELRLRGVRNVIIRNLTLLDSPDTAIAISTGTERVWIDHCTISGAPDGLIDITTGADLVTVSWCHLRNAERMGLTGRVNDKATDKGAIRVTYHHNWFEDVSIRVPYGAWGKIHVFNNYYTNIENYGIGIAAGSRIVSEANFWEGARRSYLVRDKDVGWGPDPGTMVDQGSIFTRIGRDDQTVPDIPIGWKPGREYAYAKNHALNVPRLVKSGAGAGVIQKDPVPPGSGAKRP